MARKPKPATTPADAVDEVAEEIATDAVEIVELPGEGEVTTTMRIVSDRDELQVGDRVRTKGELLATIVLEHDVNIGFVTRAIQDCLARAVHVDE